MSVMCIKNVVGEDLIGELSNDLEGNVILEKPFLVAMVPQGGTQSTFNLAMIPYLQFANDLKFLFKKEHVLLVYEPALELANRYREIAGSGLVVARPADLSLIK